MRPPIAASEPGHGGVVSRQTATCENGRAAAALAVPSTEGRAILNFPRWKAIWGDVRRYGVVDAAIATGLALVSRLCALRVVVCVALDLRSEPERTITPDDGSSVRQLAPDALAWLPDDADLDLTAAFVDDALQRGDDCFAFMDDRLVTTYCWFSTQETEPFPGYVVKVPARSRYTYKAFTRRGYRGRGLLATCLTAVGRQYAASGCERLIALIERRNVSSLRAFGLAGFRPVGRAVLGRFGSRRFVLLGRGCRNGGVMIGARLQPSVEVARHNA